MSNIASDDITEAARNIAVLLIRKRTLKTQIEAAFERGMQAGASKKKMRGEAKKAGKEIEKRRKEHARAKEQADQIIRDLKHELSAVS